MRIGVPKEIKPEENRVAITPSGVAALTAHGHIGARRARRRARQRHRRRGVPPAGRDASRSAREVWARAEMILKVKEPLAAEYRHLRAGLILFTYLHLAAPSADPRAAAHAA